MTELDAPFSGVDGAFKSSAVKLIAIKNLLPFKTPNPRDMMLYSNMNELFHQRLHLGPHKNILIN